MSVTSVLVILLNQSYLISRHQEHEDRGESVEGEGLSDTLIGVNGRQLAAAVFSTY